METLPMKSESNAPRQAKRDCPFCGAPKAVPRAAISFWVNMMVRLGISEWSQRRKEKLQEKP